MSRLFKDVRARLVECNECDERLLLMVGTKFYPNARGRRCWRYSKIAENEAEVVGFSREEDYLIRVRFEGQKQIKTCAFGFFHRCKVK